MGSGGPAQRRAERPTFKPCRRAKRPTEDFRVWESGEPCLSWVGPLILMPVSEQLKHGVMGGFSSQDILHYHSLPLWCGNGLCETETEIEQAGVYSHPVMRLCAGKTGHNGNAKQARGGETGALGDGVLA